MSGYGARRWDIRIDRKKGPIAQNLPSSCSEFLTMSDAYLTRAIPNRHVEELRNQTPRVDNALPASTYIKGRVDELKRDTDQLKDYYREIASAMVRLDDSCFEEFGRMDQRLYRIEESMENLTSIMEKQAQSVREIQEMVEEVLDHAKGGRNGHRPTVHWALDPPNGEEPQGRGGSSDESERQFETNEEF
jgi:methyl-accepting chemotaxis protein